MADQLSISAVVTLRGGGRGLLASIAREPATLDQLCERHVIEAKPVAAALDRLVATGRAAKSETGTYSATGHEPGPRPWFARRPV